MNDVKMPLAAVLTVVSLSCFVLHAGTKPALYRLKAGGDHPNYAGGAMTNGVWWLDEENNQCPESSSLDPSADYVVSRPWYNSSTSESPYATAIRTALDADTVFGGRSLIIGESTWSKAYARLYLSAGSPYRSTYLNEGLVLKFGYVSLLDSKNAEFDVYGKITVLSTGSGNSTFRVVGGKDGYTGQTVNFRGPLCGDETAVMSVGGGDYKEPVTANFMDVSGYAGRLDCFTNNVLGASGASSGSIDVMCRGALCTATPSNDLSVARLTMATGSVIIVRASGIVDSEGVPHATNGVIRVTEELSMEEGLPGSFGISMSMDDICFDGRTNRFVILAAPKEAGITAEMFTLDFDMRGYPEDMRRLGKLEVEEGEAEYLLVFTFQPVVQLVTGDNDKQTSRDGATTSMADGAEDHWSDKRLPHAGAHYVVLKTESGSARYLNTMGAGCVANAEYEHRNFPGESLTIGDGCFLTVYQGPTFGVKYLRLLDGSCIRIGQHCGNTEITGDSVTVPSGTVNFRMFSNFTMTFAGALSGAGLIRIPGTTGTGSPQGSMKFAGDTSAFGGRIIVTPTTSKTTIFPSVSRLQTLIVTNGFGGVMPEMTWDGIRLERMGRLLVEGEVSLGAGSNRGLYIEGAMGGEKPGYAYYGIIKILSKCAFAVETQLTMNGHLYKDGPGTLTLAAPVKFGEGAVSDMPLADSNLVTVAEGRLRVASADAADGLEIRLKGDAKLVLGNSAADAEFLKYGIRNVKTDTPFVLPDGADTLPLEIEYPSDIPEEGVVMGIVTVRSGIADSVCAMLPAMPSRHDGKIVRRVRLVDGENGWTTFAAEIGVRHGTQIIVR